MIRRRPSRSVRHRQHRRAELDRIDPVLCPDCGIDVMPYDAQPGSRTWQRYMVHDHVWAAAGLRELDGWFCISCLERRLERALTGADFPPQIPLNWPDVDGDNNTPYLNALKRAAAGLD